MSNRLVPAPYFPIPPSEYDQRYFNEVIRAFSVFLEQSRNPGEGRMCALVLVTVGHMFVNGYGSWLYKQLLLRLWGLKRTVGMI
jgi:hypothetical protein